MGIIDKAKAAADSFVDSIKDKAAKVAAGAADAATGGSGSLGKAKAALKSRKQVLDDAEAVAVGTTAASRKAADDEFKKAWDE